MGVTQINLGDSTERKCTKYGLAHQIPPDLSVRLKQFFNMCSAIFMKNSFKSVENFEDVAAYSHILKVSAYSHELRNSLTFAIRRTERSGGIWCASP